MNVTAMAQAYAAMAANLSEYAVQVTGGDSNALTLINNKLDVLISNQSTAKTSSARLVQSGAGSTTTNAALQTLRPPRHGMHAQTGRLLGDTEHLQQSIADILMTRIGSRVMRRNYGSRLFELLDKPLNPNTVLQWTTAIADALERWEPRFKLQQVTPHLRYPTEAAHGKWWVELAGEYLGSTVKLGVAL